MRKSFRLLLSTLIPPRQMTDSFQTHSVQFVGHVIADEYTEYHMKVTSSDGASWLVRRRYREFRELHDHLKLKYPDRMPSIPGKRLFGNQDPEFVRQRQDGLNRYMSGILALEPDCRTWVLQKFLEIKNTLPGSPIAENRRPVSSTPPPPAGAASVQSPPIRVDRTAEMDQAIEECRKGLYDLSVAPALLDAGEYSQRQSRYKEIFAAGTPGRVQPPMRRDLNDPFSKSVWFPGRESAKDALGRVLGTRPIATESELVAFFTLQTKSNMPAPTNSSSTPVSAQ
jgi:hypothetical protein